MKISAVNPNPMINRPINNKKASFRGHFENYVKTFDSYAYQKLGKGFSSEHNKNIIMGTYNALIKALKQFPDSCKTPLFNEIFNDPKYLTSPFELITDLHEGKGSFACQALSVEARKHHGCYETSAHHAYPLIFNNEKDKKACLVIEHFDIPPLFQMIRSVIGPILGAPEEKNGFYNIKFIKDFHNYVEYNFNNKDKIMTFVNNSEIISHFHRLYHMRYRFNSSFEHIESNIYH